VTLVVRGTGDVFCIIRIGAATRRPVPGTTKHLCTIDGARMPPSQRVIRQAWLTDQIRAVHTASRGTYGARRVHAELTLGLGLAWGTVRWRC
jgi:hypothetical protein